MPTIYLLGLGWANGWVLFESAHHLPAGYELGELFQNPQLNHNVPTGYIVLRPQCFSFTQASRCTPSPDLFEDFTYTADMEADFNQIDSIPTTNITRAETPQVNADPPQQFSAVFPGLPRNRKIWVIFRGKVLGIYNYGWAFHWIQSDQHAHLIVLVNPRYFTLKALATLFRGLSPIAILQKPHGLHSFGMEPTPIMVEVHGWFIMGNNLGSSLKCKCCQLLHVIMFNV